MRSAPAIAISLWLGAMAFFAFAVAPAAFATLDREAAGRFVSAVFPRYYLVGVALGVIALAAGAARAMWGGWRGVDGVGLALVALMLALTLYAWAVVLPEAHAAREAMRAPGADAGVAARFARLHRVSGALNGTVMLAGAIALALEVTRRP